MLFRLIIHLIHLILSFLQIQSLIPTFENNHANSVKPDFSDPAIKRTFYVSKNNHLMAIFLRRPDKFVEDCYVTGDRFLIQRCLSKTHKNDDIYTMKNDTMYTIVDICTYGKWQGKFGGFNGRLEAQQLDLLDLKFNGLFIFPGTKWCGAGDIADNYDDLGPEVEADKCCRTHDHCNDSILAYESKYGLENDSPITVSHCACDSEFHQCLLDADTVTSNRIGRIYFNFLQMECFKKEHPITGCKISRGYFRKRCQEYEYDKEKDPVYQYFDAQFYEHDSNETRYNYRDDGSDIFDYILDLEYNDFSLF